VQKLRVGFCRSLNPTIWEWQLRWFPTCGLQTSETAPTNLMACIFWIWWFLISRSLWPWPVWNTVDWDFDGLEAFNCAATDRRLAFDSRRSFFKSKLIQSLSWRFNKARATQIHGKRRLRPTEIRTKSHFFRIPPPFRENNSNSWSILPGHLFKFIVFIWLLNHGALQLSTVTSPCHVTKKKCCSFAVGDGSGEDNDLRSGTHTGNSPYKGTNKNYVWVLPS
jgi:hypothetical protein